MKKIILKTALITFGVTLILAISAFGITSFCAPAVMMDLTDSLGLESISGDYAYQEYQHSKDISYLARSFEIAAECGNDSVAKSRFDQLYEHEEFGAYCEAQDEIEMQDGVPVIAYRAYVCGNGACVMYRLARTEEEKADVYAFALSETDASFPRSNPLSVLAVEAAYAKDGAFCAMLLSAISAEEKFSDLRAEMGVESDSENCRHYIDIITILEEAADE